MPALSLRYAMRKEVFRCLFNIFEFYIFIHAPLARHIRIPQLE